MYRAHRYAAFLLQASHIAVQNIQALNMFEHSIFGNIFDFDGDGKVDLSEEIVGFGILHEIEKEEKANQADDDFDFDFDFKDDSDEWDF